MTFDEWAEEIGSHGFPLVQIAHRPTSLRAGVFRGANDELLLVEVTPDGLTRAAFLDFVVLGDLLRSQTLIAGVVRSTDPVTEVHVQAGESGAEAVVSRGVWLAYIPAVFDGRISVTERGAGRPLQWMIESF